MRGDGSIIRLAFISAVAKPGCNIPIRPVKAPQYWIISVLCCIQPTHWPHTLCDLFGQVAHFRAISSIIIYDMKQKIIII